VRALTTSCLLLLLVAGPARAGEPPADGDVGRRARLLLSDEAEQRAEGERLLRLRLRAGGDLAAFVRDLAKAQAARARSEDHVVEALVGLALGPDPAVRERATRALAALGDGARERLLERLRASWAARLEAGEPAPAPPPVPPLEAPAPAAPAAERPAGARAEHACEASVAVIEVGDADVTRVGVGGAAGAEPAVRVEAGPASQALAWRAEALALPDAVLAVEHPYASVGADAVLLPPPRVVRYRRDVERGPEGAWRVVTDEVATGYEVALAVRHAEDALEVRVRLSHRRAAETKAVTRVEPEPGLEPLDLDRAEWEVASAEAVVALAKAGGAARLAFPALGPDPRRRTVVVLSLACRPAR
jgi:hypothetical protein